MCPESIRSAEAHDEITVRLCSDRDATGQNRAEALAAVQEAYNKLRQWEIVVSQAELDSREANHSRQTPKRELSSYDAITPKEDELRVERTDSASQAIVKIKGATGSLKRLESYLAYPHVDWDREAKEPSEDKRLELEKQRIDLVRDQVDTLRGLGFPEVQIREALSKYIFGPLDRLERCINIEILTPD